jgi:hypothetical protein
MTPVLNVPPDPFRDGKSFRILFGIAYTEPLRINAPGAPDEFGHFEFEVQGPTGESFFDVSFDVFTSTGGVPDRSSWVGFNPQPEPPGFPAGAGLIGFDFDFISMSEATLRLQVVDNMRNPISFTVVPEPSTLLLLGSGLAGLAGLRRKFKGSKV